ncbi:helicase-related protein [Porphyrobacter sp. LM 6]|uniref:helicase-related protein n=1 Tax=Porphyrobacter sp. LM 6 TaxID=1896196 RepID=UPI00084708D6|nr:helicase-related protein [Porphyrobacter sp. LM 6]
MPFKPGERVRLKRDPSSMGIVTDAPPQEMTGRLMIEVEFPSGRARRPASQLERVEAETSAIEDLRNGKLSSPIDLRRTINHLRMTGKLADMIYAMGATNTQFHAYQFKPLLKLLNAPARGLLIADEVGLGKTIEAGLIWTELVARFDARRLLVVCPKPLVEKWRAELRSKFNVEAKACNAADLLDLLRDDAERRQGFAAVVSLSSIRPPAKWNDDLEPNQTARGELARLLADEREDELFDLVIFDEAHHMRNADTANHKLGQLVTEASDYSLLLSATPINLRSNDLRVLLKLLDPDTFENEWQFSMLQDENAPLVAACEAARNPSVPLANVAKLIEELPPGRVLKTGGRLKRLRAELAGGMEDTPETRVRLAARLEEMSLLGSIVNRTRRRDVTEFKVERRPQTITWDMSAEERNFYDRITHAIERYAFDRDLNERFLLAQTQRLLASSLASAYRHWGEKTGNLSLDEEDDDAPKSVPGPLISVLGDICNNHADLAELEHNDTKFNKLSAAIKGLQVAEGDQKLIVFSSFRRVIGYLKGRLEAQGINVLELHGGIKEDRQQTVERFADAPGGTVLLTSEVGGEGLDLQFCRIVLNWDLPWNPMKVEQRIGRVDRIGQQAETVDIINLIASNTIEEIVYDRLYKRLDIIRYALGDFEPILGDIVKDLDIILSDPKLSLKEKAKQIELATMAAETRKQQADQLEREAPGLIAHGENILNRIKEANAPHKMLTSSDLRDYIVSTLVESFPDTRFDRVPNSPAEIYEARLSSRAMAEFSRFLDTSAKRYPTRFRRDGGSGVRVIFGSNPDPGRYRAIDTITMTHPLARFASEIRQRRLAGLAVKPVTSLQISRDQAAGIKAGRYAVAVERWSIDGLVPVDKLFYLASEIQTGRIVSSDDAEKLLIQSLASNPSLSALAPEELNSAIDTVENAILEHIAAARDDFENAEAARHYDQIETQIALVQEHRDRKRIEMETRIRDLELSGGDVQQKDKKLRSAKMHRGKLDKFLARMDVKLDDLKVKEDAFEIAQPQLVGVAIIEVRG